MSGKQAKMYRPTASRKTGSTRAVSPHAEPNELRAAERSVRLPARIIVRSKLEVGYFGELAEGLNNFCPFI
jgi:hypothetical protein